MAIKKTYIYSGTQILTVHNRPHTAAKYFYLHDRLGSVRQIINTSGLVKKYYTYEPFGQSIESGGTFADPFRFTGQFYDEEIAEYYLRARQYNPTIARLTARDPVFGKLEEPLTLHKYLYCANDPVNETDLTGAWAVTAGSTIHVSGGNGGTQFSLQYFYGMSDDLTFFTGYMLTVGGSLELTKSKGMSISAQYVMGYSPNAQSPEDLGGFFIEGGGSAGAGFSAGGSYAWSPTTNVQLRTVAMGAGLGGSIYAHGTWTWVFSDFTIGPSMHTRQRSPFEQKLTDMQDWFDNRLIGLVR